MVKAVFKHFQTAAKYRQQTILEAAGVIAIVYLFSAILGFVRNRVLSGYFGDSTELGIYFAADDIPNITFTLIVSGALSAAFIPVFNKFRSKSEESAWLLTSNIVNVSLILFLIVGTLIFTFSETLVSEVVARNSNLSVPDKALFVGLLRILMLAQIGFILSSFMTSVLQSYNQFMVPALAPVFLNIGVILTTFLFYDSIGIYAPAWGTVVGSLLHVLVQLPGVKDLGYKYKIFVNWKDQGLWQIYRLMLPRTVGQTAQKLIIPLYSNLALSISGASNAIFTFADDLQSLPVRIFGMSIGQAALPIFAAAYKEDDPKDFRILVTKTLSQVLFFVLPASVIVFILRVPLVRLSVGAKIYSWEATVMTAYTLSFFSFALVSQALILILSRAFYSLSDTKTPFKISLFSLVLNAFLAIVFVRELGLGVWSLALASSVATILNSILLFVSLAKKLDGFDLYGILHKFNRICFSSIIMGVMLYIPMKFSDKFVFDTTRTIDLILLTGFVSIIGVTTYIFLVKMFKIRELDYSYILLNGIKYFQWKKLRTNGEAAAI
jgi:putative peptidoglycan lipid II flippase